MGKGNRSRIERAMNESATTDKNVKAKKNKISGAGIFVIIAAILVVIALLVGSVSMINETGFFARTQTVTNTENGEFPVTGTMMNYFFMSILNQNYQQMYQMCQQYGLITSTTSQSQANAYVYSMMGITPGVSLKSQYVDEAKTTTVFARYMQLTEEYVARLLTGCTLASKYDVKLDDEDLADIEDSLKSMKQSYDLNKMFADAQAAASGQVSAYPATYEKFLSQTYGTGVNEDDIRACMKLMLLSSKFDEKLYEEKEAFVEKEEDHKLIEEYVESNPASFLMADYYLYTFTVKSSAYGGSDTQEWEDAVNDIKAKAEKLTSAEGKEGFKTAVLELLKESEKKAFQEKNWDKYLEEAEGDEDAAQAKLDEAFEKQWTAVKDVKYNALHKEGYKYPSTATDLSKWIFGYEPEEHDHEDGEADHEHEEPIEAAKEGDIKSFESETETEETIKETTSTTGTAGTTAEETTTEGAAPAAETTTEAGTTSGSSSSTTKKEKVKTFTISVYMLDKEAYRDTEITKHIGFVMFESKENAQKFLDEFNKLETKDKDSMMDLVEELYAEMAPANYGAYENYKVGDLKDQNVTGIDEWLEKAEKGNVSDVLEITQKNTTTSSSSTNKETTYYGVMVFDGDGYEYWFQQAMVGAADEQVTKWYEDNTLELTFKQGVYALFNPKF